MRFLVSLVVLAACHDPAATSDGGKTVDANPLLTTPNEWVWVPIDGTTCANGTTAGFGLDRAATAGGALFVYFEGGGACWDTATCTANPPVAVNLDVTYSAAKLATDVTALTVDRTVGAPLDTANFVFVPYCTGDLHAGTTITTYPNGPTIHHTGGTNTQAFVDALAGAFPDAPTLWITGSSAGGYGATLDFHRFTNAWPSAGVHLLEDSSPFIPFVANYDKLQTAWAIAFPPGCTNCATTLTSAFDAVAAAHPTSRLALMTWDNDATIAAYFGYTTSLAPVQDDLITNHFDHANTHVFEATGTSHTMFGQLATITSHGVRLSDWVTQWLVGDAAWATVRP
jgi:Pectinacetylesterase